MMPQTTFDPTKIGAIPFDPSALGAVPVVDEPPPPSEIGRGPGGFAEKALAQVDPRPLAKALINAPQETIKTVTEPLTKYPLPWLGVAEMAVDATKELGKTVYEDIKSGNYQGAAGTVAGAALPFAFQTGPVKTLATKASQAPSRAMRRWGQKTIEQVYDPTPRKIKALVAEISEDLAERSPIRATQTGIHREVQARALRAGEKLEEGYNLIPQGSRELIDPIWMDIQKMRDKLVAKGTGPGTGIKAVLEDSRLDRLLMNYQAKLLSMADAARSVSTESLVSWRKLLDKKVAESPKGFVLEALPQSERATIAAQRETGNAIRRELAKQHPDIATLNAEYHFWKSAETALDYTTLRKTGRGMSLVKRMGALSAGVAGGAHGGLEMGLLTGAGALALESLFEGPAWRAISARVKSKMANLLAAGKVSEALSFAGISQIGINTEWDYDPQTKQLKMRSR